MAQGGVGDKGEIPRLGLESTRCADGDLCRDFDVAVQCLRLFTAYEGYS